MASLPLPAGKPHLFPGSLQQWSDDDVFQMVQLVCDKWEPLHKYKTLEQWNYFGQAILEHCLSKEGNEEFEKVLDNYINISEPLDRMFFINTLKVWIRPYLTVSNGTAGTTSSRSSSPSPPPAVLPPQPMSQSTAQPSQLRRTREENDRSSLNETVPVTRQALPQPTDDFAVMATESATRATQYMDSPSTPLPQQQPQLPTVQENGGPLLASVFPSESTQCTSSASSASLSAMSLATSSATSSATSLASAARKTGWKPKKKIPKRKNEPSKRKKEAMDFIDQVRLANPQITCTRVYDKYVDSMGRVYPRELGNSVKCNLILKEDYKPKEGVENPRSPESFVAYTTFCGYFKEADDATKRSSNSNDPPSTDRIGAAAIADGSENGDLKNNQASIQQPHTPTDGMDDHDSMQVSTTACPSEDDQDKDNDDSNLANIHSQELPSATNDEPVTVRTTEQLAGSPKVRFISPPKSNSSSSSFETLQKLSVVLNDPEFFASLENALKENGETEYKDSYQLIQGKRIELWIDVEEMSSKAFDMLVLAKMGCNTDLERKSVKEALIEYIQTMAAAGDGAGTGTGIWTEDYWFGNLSLIIVSGSGQQVPHEDDPNPHNKQFIVNLSKGSTSTMYLKDSIGKVHNMDDLMKLMGQKFQNVEIPPALRAVQNIEIPPALRAVLNKHQADDLSLLAGKVREYGDLLGIDCSSAFVENQMTSKNNCPLGEMAVIDGGAIHAGPKSVGTRAVLFCTATKNGESAYNVHKQSCPLGAMIEIICWTWHHPEMNEDSRLFLLKVLHKVVAGCKYYDKLGEFVNFIFPEETNDYEILSSLINYLQKKKQNQNVDKHLANYAKEFFLVPHVSPWRWIYKKTEVDRMGEDVGFHTIDLTNTNGTGLSYIYHRLVDGRLLFQTHDGTLIGDGDLTVKEEKKLKEKVELYFVEYDDTTMSNVPLNIEFGPDGNMECNINKVRVTTVERPTYPGKATSIGRNNWAKTKHEVVNLSFLIKQVGATATISSSSTLTAGVTESGRKKRKRSAKYF